MNSSAALSDEARAIEVRMLTSNGVVVEWVDSDAPTQHEAGRVRLSTKLDRRGVALAVAGVMLELAQP